MLEARPPALLGCRCPSSVFDTCPGTASLIRWFGLPAETISRADVGEVSLMSAHVDTLPQHPTGVWMLWRHRPWEGGKLPHKPDTSAFEASTLVSRFAILVTVERTTAEHVDS